jgi:hypothetical protein
MDFKNFIRNKTVAFVGGCPNIMGMGLGEKIDSYDIVVKSGGSVFLDSNNHFHSYGKRLHVLYVNVQFTREMRPLSGKLFTQRNVKYLCTKTKDHDYLFDKDPENLQIRDIGDTMGIVNESFHGATMGSYIFKDLLLCEPKELYITGIDFFVSKKKEFEHDNYKEYLPGYLPDKIREQGNVINKGKTEDGHNLIENTKYIKTLFNDYEGIVHTDKFIYKIMDGLIKGEVCQK